MFKNKGFTLIELMVVIVIIGVLAALAIPRFMDASAKAKMAEVPTIVKSWENAILANVAETGLPGLAANITFTPPTSRWFTYPAHAGGITADAVFTATAQVAVGTWTTGAANAVTSTVAFASGNTITHAFNGTSAAAMAKYCPNFTSGVQ